MYDFSSKVYLVRSKINISSAGDEVISKFTVYNKLFLMAICGVDSNLSKLAGQISQ